MGTNDNSKKETNESSERTVRPTRTPIGTRNKLTVHGLKDTDEFVYRWVNDTPGRVDELWNMGYDVVDRNGKSVGEGNLESAKGVGSALTKGVGQGVTAYLMKIPRKTWEDSRKERVDNPTNELEAGMFPNGEKGTYGGVRIENKGK